MTNPIATEDHTLIGKVHTCTMRMTELARTIERLHPESPSRQLSIEAYCEIKRFASTCRDSIVCRETRKLANFFLRTARKPVDNSGNPVIK
jgi:hypothetical protein